MFDPMKFEIDEPEKVVYVVGIGPGDVYYLTQEAQNVLEHADAICGYKLYLDLIEPEFPCEEYYSTGMTKEIDRCRWALEKADTGRRVVMVCSGDAGVYGMASPVLELAQDYPAVTPAELIGKDEFPLSAFLSQTSSNYLSHSPSLLFSPQKKEGK